MNNTNNKKKLYNVDTPWGQAVVVASASQPRPDKTLVRFTVAESTAVERAAKLEGVTPEVFLRALFYEWHAGNWQKLK